MNVESSSSEAAKARWNNAEYQQKVAAGVKTKWEDKEYRSKVTKATKAKCSGADWKAQCSRITRQLWSNPNYRRSVTTAVAKPSSRRKISAAAKALWRTTAYRSRMLSILISQTRREQITNALAQQPRVSSIQTLLYSMLGDLGVKYFSEHLGGTTDAECIIGPWTFDCAIPRDGKPTLLIECQGDYRHSRKEAVYRDKAKASYIANNFQDSYEVKYLWEHEFKCYSKVVETLRYWIGTPIDVVVYELTDLTLRYAPAADYKPLLGKYHYLPNAGRGGVVFGAYLADTLAAVCVFSPPARHNIDTAKFKLSEACEISRLCVHPKYRKNNLLTWFLARCIKQLDEKFKLILAYSDTTFNHTGAVYKAANFTFDRTVPPDYWYVSADGWAIHKKTLYGHAKSLAMTEAEFAASRGYSKVFGHEKLRFIYVRD